MTDAEFQKVTQSDNLLYGPRKLLLCGFPADAQSKFITLLKMIGLSEMPMVWVTEDQADVHVGVDQIFGLGCLVQTVENISEQG